MWEAPEKQEMYWNCGNIGSAEIVATVEIQQVKELHVRRTGEMAGSVGTTSDVEN